MTEEFEDAEQKRLVEIFKEIDEDGNQTLEREEIQHLAERMGSPLSDVDLDTAMAQLDPDSSGHVTFANFSRWYVKKHAEGGEHAAVLQLVEKEVLCRQLAREAVEARFMPGGAGMFANFAEAGTPTAAAIPRAASPVMTTPSPPGSPRGLVVEFDSPAGTPRTQDHRSLKFSPLAKTFEDGGGGGGDSGGTRRKNANAFKRKKKQKATTAEHTDIEFENPINEVSAAVRELALDVKFILTPACIFH